MGNPLKFSIVIPAYNEEVIIRKTLQDVSAAFREDCEIIVVLNGCRDSTLSKVRRETENNPGIRIINFEERLNKGGAIIEGFKAAAGQYIGFVDADGPFNPLALKEALEQHICSDKTDCLIISKWKGRGFSQVAEPLLKKALSRGLNLICRVFFDLGFYDTQGGTKFLSHKAWDKLGTDFLCRDYMWDVELLLRLKKRGLRIEEIYIPCLNLNRGYGYLLELLPMFLSLTKLLGYRYNINQ